MKFLLDQGLPRSTVQHLASAGFAAEHVSDLGLAQSKDEEVLVAARDRQAVVVTFDADFHRLLAMSGAATPSIVRIRIEGLKGDRIAQILQFVSLAAGAEIDSGAIVSVTPNRIRVRKIPFS